MRAASAFLAALFCVGALGFYAADAFSSASVGPRAASASVVVDWSAYLALARNPESPHAAFVSQDVESGVVSIAFGGAEGVAGGGLSPGARYFFHDLLLVTNQGAQPLFVQALAEAAPGALDACLATGPGEMARTCYASASPSVAAPLAVGESAWVGLAFDASGVDEGESIAGSLRIVACRDETDECAVG